MGFFDWLSGKPRRFLSPKAHAANLELQMEMSPATLQVLRQHGMTAQSRARLEYYFQTDAEAKASALSAALGRLGYREIQLGADATRKGQWLVTGWTVAMTMSEPVVLAWTRKMCEVGNDHDSEFGGWGTDGSG